MRTPEDELGMLVETLASGQHRELARLKRDLLVRDTLEKALQLGILEIDPETLEYFYNDVFAAMHDYDRNGYASNWAEASQTIDPEDHPAILDCIAGTDDFMVEYRIHPMPEETRYLQATGTTILGTEDYPEMRAMLVKDITEEREREEALRQFDHQFRTIFETSPVGMALVDKRGVALRINKAVADILGLTLEEVSDDLMDSLVHPEDRELFVDALTALQSGFEESVKFDRRYRHADGHWVTVEFTLSALGETSVGGAAYIAQSWDVTAAREVARELRDEADHDALTGLSNRRVFDRELAERFGGSGALLLVDADQFKHHNDTYGHQMGDKILVGIARALGQRLRSTDLLARIGGDEFAVVLGHADRDTAVRVAGELVEQIKEVAYGISPDTDRPITVSIGVAVFDEASDSTHLVRLADSRLYFVKQNGRNGWSIG